MRTRVPAMEPLVASSEFEVSLFVFRGPQLKVFAHATPWSTRAGCANSRLFLSMTSCRTGPQAQIHDQVMGDRICCEPFDRRLPRDAHFQKELQCTFCIRKRRRASHADDGQPLLQKQCCMEALFFVVGSSFMACILRLKIQLTFACR